MHHETRTNNGDLPGVRGAIIVFLHAMDYFGSDSPRFTDLHGAGYVSFRVKSVIRRRYYNNTGNSLSVRINLKRKYMLQAYTILQTTFKLFDRSETVFIHHRT